MRTLVDNQKVKMKLSQPRIMCSGRAAVECYYRGRVKNVSSDNKQVLIAFKYDGVHGEYVYDCEMGEFIDDDLKDIVIL